MACRSCADQRARIAKAIRNRKPVDAVRHTAKGAATMVAKIGYPPRRGKGA